MEEEVVPHLTGPAEGLQRPPVLIHLSLPTQVQQVLDELRESHVGACLLPRGPGAVQTNYLLPIPLVEEGVLRFL